MQGQGRGRWSLVAERRGVYIGEASRATETETTTQTTILVSCACVSEWRPTPTYVLVHYAAYFGEIEFGNYVRPANHALTLPVGQP
jgi:hypothetical protein